MDNMKILAKVGNSVITEDEVSANIEALKSRGQDYDSPEGRNAILEQLIGKHLFLNEAQKNFYEGDPVFQAELKKIKEDLLASFAIQKALANVTVSDDEVKKFYDEHKSELTGGETVDASHILVDSEEKANEILADIKAEKITFEDAAKEYSSCPSSSRGGSLGEFGRGQMVPEFDSAVFSMEAGEIAGPIKTQFGFHLIRLNHKKEAAEIPFEQIKAQLSQQVLSQKQQAAYTSKVNQLKLLFPVDLY